MVITLKLWPTRGRNRTGARTVLASELTDGQWNLIKDLFAERPTGGRPRVAQHPCLEGVLWVLRPGARWKEARAGHQPIREEQGRPAVVS